MICEWWFKVNCTDSPNLYAESAEHLREDVARRKHLKKIGVNNAEPSHGAIMRIEEASSVSVRRNGKNIIVNEKPVENQRAKENIKEKQRLNVNNKNFIETQNRFDQVEPKQKNANSDSVNFSKNRRYNDDQTGNYLNNDYQDNKKYSSQKPTVTKPVPTTARTKTIAGETHTLKEYHVQFSATSPGLDRNSYENYNTNTQPLPTTIRPQDQSKTNRGNVKFRSQNSEYELQFPKHQSEYKSNTVKTTQKPSTENRNTFSQISDANSAKISDRNLDHAESDEAQITQESSSFVKNSVNSIQDNSQKYSTFNPYPNHRTTYSDLKTPVFTPSKSATTISSVTPQYITTQSINNGKPFLGSRVGAKIHTSIGTVPVLANYSSTTQSHIYFSDGNTEKPSESFKTTPSDFITNQYSSSITTEDSKKSAKFLVTNIRTSSTDNGKSGELLNSLSSSSPIINKSPKNSFSRITIPSTTLPPLLRAGSSPQPFLATSSERPSQSSVSDNFILSSIETTTRKIDHATIYGTYSRGSSTTPAPRSFSQGTPFKFDKNADKISVHLSKSLGGTTALPSTSREEFVRFNQNQKPIKIGSSQTKLPKSNDKVSAQITKQLNGASAGPFINFINTTPLPNENPKYGNSVNPPLLHLDAFVRTSDLKSVATTKSPETLSSVNLISENVSNRFKTVTNVKQKPGFFVTKDSAYESTPSSTEGTTQRPRPFEKLSAAETGVNLPVTPTYVNYKISSASPFKLRDGSKSITPIPTSPTLLTTTPSVYQNLDNMINVLKKLVSQQENDYSSETPRPGLVIPPSVGPQTLHTLAVYFANALDGISTDKETIKEIEDEGITKEKLANLLTQMTVHGYGQLFNKSNGDDENESTTIATDEGENGLELQSSKNIAQTPHIRELARNFSLALSSYLHDPEMFKKDLEDLRPTEPPSLEEETIKDTDNAAEEELLNFSDADAKSSFPPIFSTGLPSPSPTWGFILATKPDNDIDVKNSLNPDLHTADSQSFVPRFNNLNVDDKKPSKEQLPEDHWTTSPSATKLWKSTFSVHPAFVNDQFGTTPLPPSSETDSAEIETLDNENLPSLPTIVRPHHEINYELRTLPKLRLNSTQIHGILIDFMNTTTPDSDRLHRILKKLNTSEDEFLNKMKEIESNPLTKRLILLLISECGENAAKEIENIESKESLEVASSGLGISNNQQKSNSYIPELVDASLSEEDQDTRALQLLNSLYSIASKFGRR